MILVSELSLSLKKNELSNIQIYCYNSKLYNDFVNKETDNCKYLILCVESRIFNSDDSTSGGHYIILNGRDGDNIKVINPIKEKYEVKVLNINFLIKACKNNEAWRILMKV